MSHTSLQVAAELAGELHNMNELATVTKTSFCGGSAKTAKPIPDQIYLHPVLLHPYRWVDFSENGVDKRSLEDVHSSSHPEE